MTERNSLVANWYDQNVALEDTRLQAGRLEYAVTLHYIEQTIAKVQKSTGEKQLTIADIGCGTGVYALPLAQAGHNVSISDISASEVKLALAKAEERNVSFATAIALDACHLRQHPELYGASRYDLQLWLGPLYHILDRSARVDVLLTAIEMCKPGGYIAVAFVTRNAHLRDVATRDPERLSKESEFYRADGYLSHGEYTRGSGPGMHHSTVSQIRELLEEVNTKAGQIGAAVEREAMVSCEGFLGFQHAMSLAKLDDEAFRKWMEVILDTAEDEATLGCADHMLVILKRVK